MGMSVSTVSPCILCFVLWAGGWVSGWVCELAGEGGSRWVGLPGGQVGRWADCLFDVPDGGRMGGLASGCVCVCVVDGVWWMVCG